MKTSIVYIVVIVFVLLMPSNGTDSNEVILYYADGEEIRLINNPNATDVTYNELISFIKLDKTDNILYVDNYFVCAEFAELLHNNAEAYGIRSAYVTVTFEDDNVGHAFNAFRTSDKGLVYIDSTGFKELVPYSADRIIDVEVGKPMSYKEINIYNDYLDGVVTSIDITW